MPPPFSQPTISNTQHQRRYTRRPEQCYGCGGQVAITSHTSPSWRSCSCKNFKLFNATKSEGAILPTHSNSSPQSVGTAVPGYTQPCSGRCLIWLFVIRQPNPESGNTTPSHVPGQALFHLPPSDTLPAAPRAQRDLIFSTVPHDPPDTVTTDRPRCSRSVDGVVPPCVRVAAHTVL